MDTVIKAVLGTVRKPTIFLGISGENFTRLMAKEPILVKLKELHPQLPDVNIVLLGGRTEEEIKVDLKEATANTFIVWDQ